MVPACNKYTSIGSTLLFAALLTGCTSSDQFQVTRVSQLVQLMASEDTQDCRFKTIRTDVYSEIFARDDSVSFIKNLEDLCPTVGFALSEADPALGSQSAFFDVTNEEEPSGLGSSGGGTRSAGNGTSGSSGGGSTGDGSDGAGSNTGGESTGGSSGGSAGGDDSSSGGGSSAGGSGKGGGGKGGGGKGGKGGGRNGNNGGGNGPEGASPGKGHRANFDENGT